MQSKSIFESYFLDIEIHIATKYAYSKTFISFPFASPAVKFYQISKINVSNIFQNFYVFDHVLWLSCYEIGLCGAKKLLEIKLYCVYSGYRFWLIFDHFRAILGFEPGIFKRKTWISWILGKKYQKCWVKTNPKKVDTNRLKSVFTAYSITNFPKFFKNRQFFF